MNAVSKVLRILAILGAVAAGALFFLTQNKVKELEKTASDDKVTFQDQLKAANAERDAASEKAAEFDSKNRQLARDLAAAVQEAKDQAALKDAAVTQISPIQAQVRRLESANADFQQQIAALRTAQSGAQDLQSQVNRLQSDNKRLEEELAAARANPSPVRPGSSRPGEAHPTMEGPSQSVTILKVVAQPGLLLLDAGTDKKVGEGNQFLLQKDKVTIGKVVVSESHADWSIATVTATGNLSASDFFKQVKEGQTLDAVQTQ